MKPERHYDALTTPERFALTVEAFARLDGAEIDRLQETMQQKSYRMSDAGYWRRLHLLNTLALTHGLRRKEIVARALSAIAVITFTDDPEQEEGMATTLGLFMGKLKAYDDAWRRFCKSIGIDPRTALKGFQVEPEDETDAIFVEIFDATEGLNTDMNEALRDELVDMYESLWDKAVSVGH